LWHCHFCFTACGGGSSSTNTTTGGGTTTGGATSGDGTPTTTVIYDATKTFPVLNQTATLRIKVTEYHQNNDTTNYNLWDYKFSPTKDSYRIFLDNYDKNVSPLAVVTPEIFQQNAEEHIYTLDPRSVTPTRDERKVTELYHYPDPNSLASIRYESIESQQFDESVPPNIIGIKIKQEHEDLVTNQDLCSDIIVSKNEILFAAIGEGFWQIGDNLTIETSVSTPIVTCDEQDIPSIVGQAQVETITTSELTNYIPVLSFRGSDFNSVLEFSGNEVTTNSSNGAIVIASSDKAYLQFHTGFVASSDKTCLGGAVNDPNALCNTEDAVANNVPTIPEL
jgi:hypothetical protein